MATLVCFHAHPDDESIATGATMAAAAAAGHRVVMVMATRGEHGEPVPGVLAEGEQLTVRRTAEVYESARQLGAARVEFLGYVDSGMMGEPTNDVPWSFWQADVDHAAERLALILREEQAEVLTVYDDHGGYGHPDHIQVNRVGHRAAALAGVEQVFESTMNRDLIERGMKEMAAGNIDIEGLEMPETPELGPDFGTAEADITHVVRVSDLTAKRGSMLAHRSQMGDDHFLLAMPEPVFNEFMGSEWYIGTGPTPAPGSLAAELFEPLRP